MSQGSCRRFTLSQPARAPADLHQCDSDGGDGEEGSSVGGAFHEHRAKPRSDRSVGRGVTATNIVVCTPAPHRPFYSVGHRGPPTIMGWTPPIRTHRSRPDGPTR